MKEYSLEKGPYLEYPKEDNQNQILFVLLFLVFYRMLNEGMIPYWESEIPLTAVFLPILFILASVLLSYGFYYIGEHFEQKKQYSKEECIIDGVLLGLLLPIHTPIIILILSVFLMIIVGRYFYHENPLFTPVIVGLFGAIGISIWFSLCHFETKESMQILFEYTEMINLTSISVYSVWTEFLHPYITVISPLLCLILLLFLMIKKAIRFRIPIYFIGGLFLLCVFTSLFTNSYINMITMISNSNFFFFSIFLASMERTSPITNVGQILYALVLSIGTFYGSFLINPSLAMMISILVLNVAKKLFDSFGRYYEMKYCV